MGGEGGAHPRLVALRPLQQLEAAAGHRQVRRRPAPGAAGLPDPRDAAPHLGGRAPAALDPALPVRFRKPKSGRFT